MDNCWEYSGILKLTDNDEAVEIPVTITVFPVEVPKEETLRITNWFRAEFMSSHFGCEKFSDEHWESIKKHGEIMREASYWECAVCSMWRRRRGY